MINNLNSSLVSILKTAFFCLFFNEKTDFSEYIIFQFSKEKFSEFEETCSGSKISSWESGLIWMKERDKRLEEEFQSNKEQFGYYGSMHGYCRSYWSDDNCKFIVYQTTSGTILIHHRDYKGGEYLGDQKYIVLLPKHREGGNHHSVLIELVGEEKLEELSEQVSQKVYAERL